MSSNFSPNLSPIYQVPGQVEPEHKLVVEQRYSPLVCCICNNYYNDPRLLSCYHTFCYECLNRHIHDRKIICPICGLQTDCERQKLPQDTLLSKLIDYLNIENPPCANCDKRDKSSMFFCSTCGQALCSQCRENIHKAKMFSSHEITCVTKLFEEGIKKCNVHNEPYIMYSPVEHVMLCIGCFRDVSADMRQNCIDIDTAYAQISAKLDSTMKSVSETQKAVKDGVIACKTNLEELRRSADNERVTVQNFTQGLQEAVAITQTNLMTDIQRQFDVKAKDLHSQLVSLGSLSPVIHDHITLCQNSVSTLNKFQFLDVALIMIDRLITVSKQSQPIRISFDNKIATNYRSEFASCLEPWVGKLLSSSVQQSKEKVYETIPFSREQQQQQHQCVCHTTSIVPSQKQHSVLRLKALEGEGPFPNHCRSFNSQVKELNFQIRNLRDRLGDLKKDVSCLQKSYATPLITRFQHIMHECVRIYDTLERNQVELERLRSVFQSIWQEQLFRIQIEQEIFQNQVQDVVSMRTEMRQLINTARSMELVISKIANQNDNDEVSQLKSLMYDISQLKDTQKVPKDKITRGTVGEYKVVEQKPQSVVDQNKCYISAGGTEDKKPALPARDIKDRLPPEIKSSRGVLSQLMDKVRKSSVTESFKERSKSEDRGKDSLTDMLKQKTQISNIDESVINKSKSAKRVSSLYHSFGTQKNRASKSLPESHEPIILTKQTSVSHYESAPIVDEQPERKSFHVPGTCSASVQFEDSWRGSAQYKAINKEKKESEYQSITQTAAQERKLQNVCYSSEDDYDDDVITYAPKKGMIKRGISSSPQRKSRRKRYAHSDTEDIAYYAHGGTPRGGSTMEIEDNGRTFVVVIGRKKKKGKSVTKQRSWGTFPLQKKKMVPALCDKQNRHSFYYNPDKFNSYFDVASIQDNKMKKADSFEGHEEAVSSLVQEFQKIRMLEKKQKKRSQNIYDTE